MRDRYAHDELLRWCSELGSGTWSQFTAACAELDLPSGPAGRAMSALAHVEFDHRQGRWAAAPVTLTTIPGTPGRLLLSGARASGMMEPLRTVADQGFDVDVSAEPVRQPHGPATLLLEGSAADAAEFASAAGIRFQPAAHLALAAVLPVGDLSVLAEPATPDPRFPHCTVDPETLSERWDLAIPEGADGLWAWPTFARRSARFIRRTGQWWYVPESTWAPYLIDRPAEAEPLCWHDPAHRRLIVDAAAPLPALHARAAVLCSGRLPLRQRLAEGIAEDHYVNVDDDTAGLIIGSLRGLSASDGRGSVAVSGAGHIEIDRRA